MRDVTDQPFAYLCAVQPISIGRATADNFIATCARRVCDAKIGCRKFNTIVVNKTYRNVISSAHPAQSSEPVSAIAVFHLHRYVLDVRYFCTSASVPNQKPRNSHRCRYLLAAHLGIRQVSYRDFKEMKQRIQTSQNYKSLSKVSN